jgi:hypothetical protein
VTSRVILTLPPTYPLNIGLSLTINTTDGKTSKALESRLRGAMRGYLYGRGVVDGIEGKVIKVDDNDDDNEEEDDLTFVASELIAFLTGCDENSEVIETILLECGVNPSPDATRVAEPVNTNPSTTVVTLPTNEILQTILQTDPLVSKGSQFIAFGCSITSPDSVTPIVDHLRNMSPKMRRATHHMVAYRLTTSSGITYHDNHEDGEDGAGVKLSMILQNMMKDKDGDGVLIVVSRWYGGIKLGPKRWQLIGTVARDVIKQLGY